MTDKTPVEESIVADDTEFVVQRDSSEEIREEVDDSVADDEISSMEGGFVRGYKQERESGFDD